jgi:hypothetical protein
MKTKILLTVATVMMITPVIMANDDCGTYSEREYGYGCQQVVVNNYYFDNGYEYASRIKRFHNSYVTFDFYSPIFTEIFWYNYTPYTWGVSIYDDWYYYGTGASRYTWRSGFGGSYWWGYDPWWDYNPWMGYGWSSWYSPGVSYVINFYLGRPYYHYPMAWNRWHHHYNWNYNRPVYIINNHTYNYNYSYRLSNRDGMTNYNPSHPYEAGRRPGYTVTGGRSSAAPAGAAAANAGRSQTDNAGRSQAAGDRERGNNGLRMGQYRRGVAEPSQARPNEPARPNNPNVDDRLDPGREKGNVNVNAGQQGRSQGNRRSVQTNTGADNKGAIDIAPAQPSQRQQTQRNVRTTTQRRETVIRQSPSENTNRTRQSTVQKSTKRGSEKSSEGKSTKKSESKKKTSSSQSGR